jgi:glycosyltransferase involved in cell wall biosynthesis
LRQVDLILTHAVRTRLQLIDEGILEERIVRIPHGNYIFLCQPSDMPREEAKRSLALPSHARVLLFFGHVEWRKGLERLIEALAILAKHDQAVRLIIAGTANEDFAPYERLMGHLGVREKVFVDLRWIPYEEMQRYFNAADVVVLPYRQISQSGVIQLAYAYSRPVVVTDVGGIGEVVSEDGTGIVSESEKPEAIAHAIRQLFADPDAAARMGERGRQLAETKYAWSGIARQVAECYRALVPGYAVSTTAYAAEPEHGRDG